MSCKLLFIILFAAFQILVPVYGSIDLGLGLCNNRWHDNWIATPAPEISYTHHWFSVGVDGTIGSYQPSSGQNGFILQTRFSFIPMLRLPLGHFAFSLGYGFSSLYRREEIQLSKRSYDIHSSITNHGELKSTLSVKIPLSSKVHLLIKGSYSYINRENSHFIAALGAGFPIGSDRVSIIERKIPDQSASEEKQQPSVPAIKKVTLIETPDPIINELNSAIEAVLIQKGIQVLNWEKVKNEVQQNTTMTVTSVTNSMDIAFEGSRLLNLDAIIETQMRYTYKSYGGDVLVNYAYLRIVQPTTGNILFATEYNLPESTFIRCKQKISGEVLNALKQLK